MPGQILAMGGGGFLADPSSSLDELIVSLSPASRPRVCYVPTPAGDSDRSIAAFFEAFSRLDCEPSCLRLFGAPEKPTEHLVRQDVIYVSGGNTANALAIWRLHGVDRALRDAWGRGAVLGGVSAGANCWFECSVTDSFGRVLGPPPRRTRNPVRQLLPALRRRGATPTGLPGTRRRGVSGLICRRRRCRAALLRYRAAGGRRVSPGGAGVSRRARQRDAAGVAVFGLRFLGRV